MIYILFLDMNPFELTESMKKRMDLMVNTYKVPGREVLLAIEEHRSIYEGFMKIEEEYIRESKELEGEFSGCEFTPDGKVEGLKEGFVVREVFNSDKNRVKIIMKDVGGGMFISKFIIYPTVSDNNENCTVSMCRLKQEKDDAGNVKYVYHGVYSGKVYKLNKEKEPFGEPLKSIFKYGEGEEVGMSQMNKRLRMVNNLSIGNKVYEYKPMHQWTNNEDFCIVVLMEKNYYSIIQFFNGNLRQIDITKTPPGSLGGNETIITMKYFKKETGEFDNSKPSIAFQESQGFIMFHPELVEILDLRVMKRIIMPPKQSLSESMNGEGSVEKLSEGKLYKGTFVEGNITKGTLREKNLVFEGTFWLDWRPHIGKLTYNEKVVCEGDCTLFYTSLKTGSHNDTVHKHILLNPGTNALPSLFEKIPHVIRRMPSYSFIRLMNKVNMSETDDVVVYTYEIDTNSAKEGKVQYIVKDIFGNSYQGETRDKKMQGLGVYKTSLGDEYVGRFEDGQFEGRGTLRFRDGSVYRGSFNKSLYHGNGCLKTQTQTLKGVWVKGEFSHPSNYDDNDEDEFDPKSKKNEGKDNRNILKFSSNPIQTILRLRHEGFSLTHSNNPALLSRLALVRDVRLDRNPLLYMCRYMARRIVR